ncbi:MAG: hypothetical protein QE487_13110 [Fluviicola sp.]|nr:hypothetical protein [Fluviicola sp.]
MNKFIFISATMLLVTTIFSACKKGENDPLFSLRSRKARLAGEWTLTTLEYGGQSIVGNTTQSTVISYDGQTETKNITTTISGVSTNAITTATYTMVLTIEKDGTFEQIRKENGVTETTKGTWVFLGKSKENELKGKEAVLLTETSFTDATGTTTYEGLDGVIYTIDQLKNKEMIWKRRTSSSDDNSSSLVDGSYTYQQK